MNPLTPLGMSQALYEVWLTASIATAAQREYGAGFYTIKPDNEHPTNDD